MQTLRTTLGEYIDYMQTPYHALAASERDAPFYGNSWSPFLKHGKLRAHISRPYFVPDAIPSEGEHERLDRSPRRCSIRRAGARNRTAARAARPPPPLERASLRQVAARGLVVEGLEHSGAARGAS